MSFLDRIAACTACDLSAYRRFHVDGVDVGFVKPDFADGLRAFPDVFDVSAGVVTLNRSLVGFEERTAAVDGVLRRLAGRGVLDSWRDEPYPVGTSFAGPAFFNMERAAVPLFGVVGYGVHMNGIVVDGDGMKMWIGRRSFEKRSAPGKLDQMVAGGQPAGMSLGKNLIKEAAEEADVPAALTARAVPVGAVTDCVERPEGLRRDVLFIYDLELPADFRPVNTDGEVAEFYLWPMDRVIGTVRDTDDFKFNCALVVVDFLVRHGFISPDHPDYMDVLRGLRR